MNMRGISNIQKVTSTRSQATFDLQFK